jgi:hypothetical protein
MEKKIRELLGSGSESRTMENDTRIFEILRKAGISELANEDFQLLERQLILNKKKMVFYCLLSYGICPDKINVIRNSSNFDLLCKNVNLFKQMYPDIRIGSRFMPTFVSVKNDDVVTIHNSIEIVLPSGSYLRISPTKAESIEISNIRVETINHSKGEGTILMNAIIDFMTTTLGYRPRIVMECNGSIGAGSNQIKIGIQRQTAFFRKFGFRVENRKHYPHYVMMSSPKSESNIGEQIFQFAA